MSALTSIIKIPELRKRIVYTLSMLILFRIGSQITIPGVDNYLLYDVLEKAKGAGQGTGAEAIFDLIDMFAGGAFKRFSIFALGIMPYISSSIIMQLLMVVVPSLQRMQKDGEEGQKKITQITRYGTILLCAVQSIGVITLALSKHIMSTNISEGMFYLLGMVTIIAGTMLLMWMGEQVTDKGIGNGISLIIFAGIIVRLPSGIMQLVDSKHKDIDIITIMVLMAIFFVMIVLSVYLSEGTRKVPLQYGKRMMGRRMVQAQSQTLPFKVNSANVMPIIFASSLMIIPQTVASMFQNTEYSIFQSIAYAFTPSAAFPQVLVYYLFYSILIIFFSYFYTAIQYNPVEIADNLKKYGGFIPGIRPGSHTKDYIQRLLNRITLPGSIFLAFIALAPNFVNKLMSLENMSITYTFGGTSLLIMVGVALETLKQVEAQLVMRHYEGFMKKGKIRGRIK